MRLWDRVAIVTGGGSGIGEAIALLYAQEGATVVVADRIDGAQPRASQRRFVSPAGTPARVCADVTSRGRYRGA